MDKCIQSCLDAGDNIEIIIVNDGSSDHTSEKAHTWEARYPKKVRVIDQENAGHGGAVMAGLHAAHGLYFKVVDSDDWLDSNAMAHVMDYLHKQMELRRPTDLVIGNYVYEKVHEGTHQSMRYKNVFPQEREFGWDDIGHFKQSQYLLMHSVIYRTELLRECHLDLPKHCFYVDNIFVYVPLPYVKSMYYLDVDMYRYFIGREGQSVNEKTMLGRIDQQLRVTRTMIDAVQLPDDVANPKLAHYMENYLSMMMCICSVFLRMSKSSDDEHKRQDIWNYLETHNPGCYKSIRHKVINVATNLPHDIGRDIGLGGYHLAQKLFKFN